MSPLFESCSPRSSGLSRFERIETLPGLPDEDKARDILESLANDPGVCSVLEKHRWTVGALCELYPEGKVCSPMLLHHNSFRCSTSLTYVREGGGGRGGAVGS